MNNYILFTDGAYSPSRQQMGIGLIFIKNDKVILEYSHMYKGGTNNIAELAAVIVGFRMIQGSIESLTVYTDSEYVIGCAVRGWERKKNKKLWEEFDRQYERVTSLCPNIQFIHVKGHQSNKDKLTKYNNQVDQLARNASCLI